MQNGAAYPVRNGRIRQLSFRGVALCLCGLYASMRSPYQKFLNQTCFSNARFAGHQCKRSASVLSSLPGFKQLIELMLPSNEKKMSGSGFIRQVRLLGRNERLLRHLVAQALSGGTWVCIELTPKHRDALVIDE